ncbi:hypothetical protein TIFTF001_013427 [Ficus carica]|uniref:Uncharacterized protein n=1 Tax=Ficus carica TaxID=3494 RepID=A0AA88A4D3_FICCA|nr:hypothetical protein TIFTF001_013427 [Ficus carica]
MNNEPESATTATDTASNPVDGVNREVCLAMASIAVKSRSWSCDTEGERLKRDAVLLQRRIATIAGEPVASCPTTVI